MGSSQREDFVYYVTPPLTLLDVLFFDSASGSTPNVTIISETFVSFDTHFLAGLFAIDSLFNKKKKKTS